MTKRELREKRIRRGLTQADLARLVGVSQPFIAQMEKPNKDGGRSVPNERRELYPGERAADGAATEPSVAEELAEVFALPDDELRRAVENARRIEELTPKTTPTERKLGYYLATGRRPAGLPESDPR